ncbi:MAG: hypothetical protein ACE5Q3_12035 [Alphaproteobacteria bacterium]
MAYSETELLLAQKVFEALCTLDTLEEREEGRERARPPITFADLYALVNDAGASPGAESAAALRADPRLAADFRQLLRNVALYHSPRLAAASSGAVSRREGPGFVIEFFPSRAQPSAMFAIIKMDHVNQDVPETLLVTAADGRVMKEVLPRPSGGSIQLLLEAGSELLSALRDPTAEVFLR